MCFIHRSARDFLLRAYLGKDPDCSTEQASPALADLHWACMTTCIDYLGAVESHEYTALPTVGTNALGRRWPFLSYAATFWHSHLELSNHEAATQRSLNRLGTPGSLIFKLWFTIWKDHQSRRESDHRGLPDRPTKVIVWCLLGNEEQVNQSLDRRSLKANYGLRSDDQWTPLMAAAWSGRIEVVTLLLNRPDVSDSRPKQKAEALIYAIERGHTAIAQSLTAFFANPASGPHVLNTVANNETPLSAAILSHNLALALLLLELGADPKLHLNRRTHRKQRCRGCLDAKSTALHYSVLSGWVELSAILLESLPERERGRQYRKLLPIASSRGATSLVKYFVGKADISKLREGTTALYSAARGGHADVVDILLKHGASIHSGDAATNYTLLQFACDFGRTQEIRLLQESSSQWAEGALFQACQSVSAPTVKHLLSSGVSARISKDGIPALQWVLIDGQSLPGTTFGKPAHEESRIEVLKLLLHEGSDLNETDGAGQTSLHRAASRGERQITDFLLSLGANVNLTDQHGNTALDIAARSGDTHWLQTFLQAGSNISNTTWKNVLINADVEIACFLLSSVKHRASTPELSRSGHRTRLVELDPHPSEVYTYFLDCLSSQRFEKAVNYLRYMHITDYAHVRVARCAPLSPWSSFTRWWEESTGQRWSWWPLPGPLPRLRSSETYIYWKCHGVSIAHF